MNLEERMEFLTHSIESHDRQMGEIMDAIAKLVEVTNQDATSIRALARIAETHDRRLTNLEGDRA